MEVERKNDSKNFLKNFQKTIDKWISMLYYGRVGCDETNNPIKNYLLERKDKS